MNVATPPPHDIVLSTSREPALLGVVLAGGKSSRMGRDKATLPHAAGGDFLEYAISRLAQLTSHVAVSGRESPVPAAMTIADQSPSLGPAMAVWSAVRFAVEAGYSSILVTPVDMPDLDSQHLQRLVDSAASDKPTCASFDGRTAHPLVAIYPVCLAAELEAVARSERRSLQAWLAQRPLTLVPLPVSAQRDCNTPASCSWPASVSEPT
ncbi:MAG: molybdenum cofactor guanylyltransferase [Planctomycetaceae bacterium]